MKARIVFAGQVALIAACALALGVKVAEAIKMVAGWLR